MARHNHLIICDICGFQYHRDEVRKNWKNQIVCHKDYEEKHPQLILRPRRDRQAVPDARVPNDPDLLDQPFTTSDIV
jgi:transposase